MENIFILYSPRVKTAMQKLLDMPNFTLTLCLIDDNLKKTLFKTIQRGGKSVKKVELKDNNVKRKSRCFDGNFETKRKREEFLFEMMHGRVKRSHHESVSRKSKGSESFNRVSPVYWFSGPLARTDRLEKMSDVQRAAVDKHVLHNLPDNFSWCLQYFASYAQISNVSLLQELSDIENLILHLDKDYFGYMKAQKRKWTY